MKKIKILALCALSSVALLNPAKADQLTYANGDLLLGFRAENGVGSNKCYVVNLGQVSQFTSANSAFTVTGLGSIKDDLASNNAFGPDWKTRADVYWSVSGTVGNFAAVGNDPLKTLYATCPERLCGVSIRPEVKYRRLCRIC